MTGIGLIFMMEQNATINLKDRLGYYDECERCKQIYVGLDMKVYQFEMSKDTMKGGRVFILKWN